MNETYVELLVKRKKSMLMALLKTLTTMLAVCFGIFGFGFMNLPALLITVVMGVAAYFISMNAEIEYEYLYVDKELTVDKIMAKSKRKRVATYDMTKIEILAPERSHRLDSYRNNTRYKMKDFTSGVVGQPDIRYTFYYEGAEKVMFEPNEEMVKAIMMAAPRKVFRD